MIPILALAGQDYLTYILIYLKQKSISRTIFYIKQRYILYLKYMYKMSVFFNCNMLK